jgi:hypothetical protein
MIIMIRRREIEGRKKGRKRKVERKEEEKEETTTQDVIITATKVRNRRSFNSIL